VTEVAADIRALTPDEYRAAIPGLADLVVDAVRAGASINFLATVTPEEAARWWEARIPAVEGGAITAFVAMDADRLVGSVLLMRSTNANSPHRAEIGKVIVHTSARRRGLASALMRAAEDRARADGRWMLVLDTVTDSAADLLYRSLGWQVTGIVPDYAQLPDGRPWAATFFWKDLR
jgi:ribosomal protein S18 acetylase RimI-like enzyme